MATRAQIKANANNAKKSTGPRTKQGKSRAAKNALKHGLLARDTVLPGEDPADFDSQLAALEADILPANSLEFELVRQIADSQWRMRRLTRLETGFIAAAVDRTRRHAKKHCPDTLRPGYDGETLLLGSAMLDHTQALVHLARYDGHLSRRFFRAVKQLADLRRDERKADEARSSAGSYTPTDPYRGPYVPAQAPPPIDTPNPTAGRIGFRASGHSAPPAGLSKMGANSRVPQGAGPPAAGSVKRPPTGRWEKIADCHKRRPERHVESVTSSAAVDCPQHFVVAHPTAVSPFPATSSPRKHPSTDPSCRGLNPHQPKMTKQTQFLRTTMKSTSSSPLFSPGGEAKRVRGPSVQGARRSAPRFLNHAGVLEPYVEHGDQAQRRNSGLIACFDR